ncbi:phenylacetate--CoA ligase family protein [Cellulomonas sp. KRMCY2]|uniref:phenylacetate--CoA ligase family protein n=1 Tax=Cellulomonas sp. KRMCY2 TaxID=1304865 RepID=UPI001E2E543A|nr:phenylacetate--CoA ligase family protein [Cellulomonas sp. KRMCY2]
MAALPAVTKAQMMVDFDLLVTDRHLNLEQIEAHLAQLTDLGGDPGVPFRGRWWTAATAGTTGRRGVFVWDRHEWATVLASYSRATMWAGVRVGLGHPVPMAVVSSRVPTHQSAVVGASLRSRTVPTLRLDARAPLAQTVEALNTFAPQVLVGYPSALRPLADEQLAGRLRIAPQAVMSASEVLTDHAARDMARAWGSSPFDVYAATETAGISSPCHLGTRHIYEDLVLVEPVDATGAAVPVGTAGARLLVTVLFSRTMPLIRYELSDRVTLSAHSCACGSPFRVLERVEGREQEVPTVTTARGAVSLHPNVFHAVLDDLNVAGWQVVQETHDRLRLLLVPGAAPVDLLAAQRRVAAAVTEAGAGSVSVEVEAVTEIPRTALGKTLLTRRLAP